MIQAIYNFLLHICNLNINNKLSYFGKRQKPGINIYCKNNHYSICCMRPIVILLFLASSFWGQAITILGYIVDEANGTKLSFASIALKNRQIGTITNDQGYFEFIIPEDIVSDTLLVNYIGYEPYQRPLAAMENGQIVVIKLTPVVNELEEVVVRPMYIKDYIEQINKAIAENYSPVSFLTKAYYREKMKENDYYVRNEEAVFESYYTGCTDTARNRHKIILWRENGPVKELAFDKQWILKQADKQKKKTLHNAEFADAKESEDGYIDFGGPNTLFSFDFTKTKQPFLDVRNINKYSYTIGKKSVYNGRKVVAIHFETKRKIDNTKYQGYFLMDEESYAVIYIEMAGKYVVPTVLQPFVFLYGVTINKSDFTMSVKYEYFNKKWYPKDFHGTLSVDAKRSHVFGPDSHYTYSMEQLFLVNKVTALNVKPFPRNESYKVGKSMRKQVHPDGKTNWKDFNIVK